VAQVLILCRMRTTVKASRAIHADHGPCSSGSTLSMKRSRHFMEIRNQFSDAFPGRVQVDARDMGPRHAISARGPGRKLIGQDPILPSIQTDDAQTSSHLRAKSGFWPVQCRAVSTAWRRRPPSVGSARRRCQRCPIRLTPQKVWEVNHLPGLQRCSRLEGIQSSFNSAQSGGKKVSLLT